MGSKKTKTGQVILFVWMTALSLGYVSCAVMKVLRAKEDTFSSPFYNTQCSFSDSQVKYCKMMNARTGNQKYGNVCSCICDTQKSTYLESKLQCVKNIEMRNSKSLPYTNYIFRGYGENVYPRQQQHQQ